MEHDQESELLELENQLNEVAAAEHFFTTASGQLIVTLLNKEVNDILKRIVSDKYLKDHMGYVNDLARLRANKDLLRKLQVAGSPKRKAKLLEKKEMLDA